MDQNKIVTFFKTTTTENLSQVRPLSSKKFIEFKAIIDSEINKKKIENFIKGIVISLDELVSVKTDVEFLFSEQFSKSDFVNHVVPLEQGTYFYTWVSIPYDFIPKNDCSFVIKDNVYRSKMLLIPYDLVFVRKDVSNEKIKRIRQTLLTGGTSVFSRKYNEKIPIPFNLKVYCNYSSS